MSIHPFPLRPVHASPVRASPVHASPVHASPVHASPVEPYFQDHRNRDPAPPLRPMTALEQMYAYWGSDRLPD